MAVHQVSGYGAVHHLGVEDLNTDAPISALSLDEDMYIEEDVSHYFDRDGELVTAYGTPGFYELWSEDHCEWELSKPHMGVVVCDSSRGSVATLASEVAAAITVLKFRFRRGDFVNFHTIPVSLLAFPSCVISSRLRGAGQD